MSEGGVVAVFEDNAALASNLPDKDVLGEINLVNLMNVRVSFVDLEAILNANGFEKVFRLRRPREAFIRAVRDVENRDQVVRKVRPEKSDVLYQFTDIRRESDHLEFDRQGIVTFDKGAEKVESDNAILAEKINGLYADKKETAETDDVRRVIYRILDRFTGYVGIRDRGGVYFVPVKDREVIDRLEKVFKALRGKAQVADLLRYTVPNLVRERAQVFDAFTSEVDTHINALDAEISEIDSARAIRNRIEDVAVLYQKAENYEALLSVSAESIRNRLNELKEKLGDRLDNVSNNVTAAVA